MTLHSMVHKEHPGVSKSPHNTVTFLTVIGNSTPAYPWKARCLLLEKGKQTHIKLKSISIPITQEFVEINDYDHYYNMIWNSNQAPSF